MQSSVELDKNYLDRLQKAGGFRTKKQAVMRGLQLLEQEITRKQLLEMAGALTPAKTLEPAP